MLYIISPSRLSGPNAIKLRKAPGKVIEKGLALLPRGGPFSGMFWRIFLEFQFPRYLLGLSPFPVAVLLFPDYALPIAQAPALMFLALYFVEYHVLSISSPQKRRQMADETTRARALDLLQVRGRGLLTRIAARRGLKTGELYLVVEQSALARVVPLTVVSVQHTEGKTPLVLELDDEERTLIAEKLFDAGFDEALLQRVNQAENIFFRPVSLEARGISAHARLEAMAATAPG
ncbi:hypothetical protein C8N32_10121 [Rhodovulum imhoffii]|uniref:Uncharacterized protein n=1 Tax=Rhodovulum imhoffii TaxID=365340 RepID=A0A2T5BW49_9RHOB|nr:hypothetical protein [Rhodovulum imhoffii]MBK5935203.1 hypothetical protein [Rhodovulum imhoffii]PTN03828.1 hypothetical protein C8N32_10121 [Rhodovulum imhoffii]